MATLGRKISNNENNNYSYDIIRMNIFIIYTATFANSWDFVKQCFRFSTCRAKRGGVTCSCAKAKSFLWIRQFSWRQILWVGKIIGNVVYVSLFEKVHTERDHKFGLLISCRTPRQSVKQLVRTGPSPTPTFLTRFLLEVIANFRISIRHNVQYIYLKCFCCTVVEAQNQPKTWRVQHSAIKHKRPAVVSQLVPKYSAFEKVSASN